MVSPSVAQSDGGLSRTGFRQEDFSRRDETDDRLFYNTDRWVEHLDALALATVERLIGELIVEERPVILDLMASWDSHLPSELSPSQVVGLGLNGNELSANPALSEHVIHDLNRDPHLPFPDGSFDVVLNTVSVDYLTQPIDVFRDVCRILKSGGLFLVVFSNRFFPAKAVRIWQHASEEERVILVEQFFRLASGFSQARTFVSKGRPRPASDKYADTGIPSDPVYAVYAEKEGADSARRPRPTPTASRISLVGTEECRERSVQTKQTLCCPHCGERMRKWTVPQTPFTEWDVDFMYICFNDHCPYFVRGWEEMCRQGNLGLSYRCMYNPQKDRCMPVPVPTLHALKEGIAD